jgi:glycosyltransferase involved in cell wall biosynthesis
MTISIIIPTFNRLPLLKNALNALLNQNTYAATYEIIPVDDGSTDGTRTFLEKLAAAHPQVKPVFQSNKGPAAARNAGAAAAKGDVLAFTDDDCEASADWVQVIAETFHTAPDLAGIQGRTISDRAGITPLTHQIHNPNGHPAVPTCNAAYRKPVFDALGGFDTSFPSAHNEDADLAWRAAQLGEVLFVPNALVVHPPRPDAFKKHTRRMQMLKAEFYLYHKNKMLYRQNRRLNPWITIYGEVFFKHQLLKMKSLLRFAFRPALFSQGAALLVLNWVQLIALFPEFVKANRSAARVHHG